MALFGGKPLSRLDELKKIVAKDPSSRQFLALAEEYRKLGRLRESMETLERGIQATPGYVAAYVALGRTCQQLGLPDQAIQAYNLALKYDRENLVAIRQIADAYLKKGEKVEAIKKLKLFRALKSGDQEVEQLIQQLDAELNPPKPKPAADSWPTAGGLRSPATGFGPARPPASPFGSTGESSVPRFEPIRPSLERSGAFARRDFPRPPDFTASPYPAPVPGVEEPSPLLTSGRIERPIPVARVESVRPAPPPVAAPPATPPIPTASRPAPLSESPMSRPPVDFGLISEPRPLPRRDSTSAPIVPAAPPSPSTVPPVPSGLAPTPERTGPIGRARIPDAAELLELTFDGGSLRRGKTEAPSPVSTAEVSFPAAPVAPPPAPASSGGSSRPITLPIPESAPVAVPPRPIQASPPPPPSAAIPGQAPAPSPIPPPLPPASAPEESVFDFDEEALVGGDEAAPKVAAAMAFEPPRAETISRAPVEESAPEAAAAFVPEFPDAFGAAGEHAPPAEEPLPWDAEDVAPLPAPEPGAGEPFALAELATAPEEAAPETGAPTAPAPEEISPFESEPPAVVSETLAELYRTQGHVVEARDTYGSLAAAETDAARAQELEARAAALSARLARSGRLRQWASRLPSPRRAEIESLGEVIEGFVADTEGVTAASLTDLEGVPVVSAGDPAIEALVAELTAFWKGVQRVRGDVGAGRLRNLTLAAEDGTALVAAASPEYSLVVKADRNAPIGRIRYEVGRVSALLRPVLG